MVDSRDRVEKRTLRMKIVTSVLLLWVVGAVKARDVDDFLAEIRALSAQGSFEEAAERLDEQYEALKGDAEIPPLDAARVGNELLRALRALQRWSEPETLPLAHEVLSTFDSDAISDPDGHKLALLNLGEILRTLGQYDQAESTMSRALRLEGGTDSTIDAELHGAYAWVLIDLGRLDDAGVHARRALELRERTEPSGESAIARDLAALGRIAELRGDYTNAVDYLQRALNMQVSGESIEPTSIALTHMSLGWSQYKLGNYVGAEANYLRAAELVRPLGSRGELIQAWSEANLGIVYEAQGRLDRARRVWRSAHKARARALGDEHPWTLASQMQLAMVLAKFGETVEALRLAQDAFATHESIHGPQHRETCIALSQVSYIQELHGDVDGSLRTALDLASRQEGMPETSVEMRIRDQVRIALAALDAGDLALAEVAIARAGAIAKQTKELSLTMESELSWALADVATRRGDEIVAVEKLRHAERNLVQLHGESHSEVARVRHALALALWRSGDVDEALERAIQSNRSGARAFGWMAPGLPEAWALRYHRAAFDDSDLSLSILASVADPRQEQIIATWSSRAAWRSIVLEALLERRRELVDEAGSNREAWQRLSEARRELASQFTHLRGNPLDASARAAFEAARAERLAAEEELVKIAGAAAHGSLGEAVPMDEIVARLARDTVLLAIERFESGVPDHEAETHYGAFVYANGHWSFLDLGEADVLDRLARRWHEEAAMGELRQDRSPASSWRAYYEAATRLREAMLDPLLPRIRGARQVLWIPAAAFHRVDPGALIAPDGRFLVESELRFRRLSHERDLLRTHSVSDVQRLVAVGDLQYGSAAAIRIDDRRQASDCDPSESLVFGRLPHTAEELDAISTHWSGELIALRGAEATEQRFVESARSASAVHLATHAYHLAGCAEETENPLLLTGLALSGANLPAQTDSDGRLSAEEIAVLDLRGVDRVVLSACDTAAGVGSLGEIALGLPRSFLEAGAREVVVSLWPVSDRATGELMEQYYATGGDLHAAEQGVLARRRAESDSIHPFSWAGFAALGPPPALVRR